MCMHVHTHIQKDRQVDRQTEETSTKTCNFLRFVTVFLKIPWNRVHSQMWIFFLVQSINPAQAS